MSSFAFLHVSTTLESIDFVILIENTFQTAGLARYMNNDHRKPNAKALNYVDSSEMFYR